MLSWKARALCLLLVSSGACASQDALTGQVVVNLTTTDPSDGTVYRLTPGSRLEVFNDLYFDTYSLDGDGPLVSINVPPGDYLARLQNPAGYLDIWPLEHVLADGTVDIVYATLATVMPAELSVPDGFSVSLVLSFRLAGGTITFGQGTIDVSLDVAAVGATGALISSNSLLTATSATFFPAAPASLPGLVPAAGTTDLLISASGSLTGPWRQRSSTLVCAPAALDVGEGPDAAFSDLVEESAGNIEVCLMGGPGAVPLLRLSFSRFGMATTPTFAGFSDDLLWETMVQGLLPDGSAYDGHTLDLSRLNGTFSLPANAFTRISAVGAGWYAGEYEGELNLTFIPTE